MRIAVLLGVSVALGLGWHALHHRHESGPQRAVEGWIDSIATDDAGEFCATTTVAMQTSEFGRGSCLERAPALLAQFQPDWAWLEGTRATRAIRGGVPLTAIVLPDGSRMSDWSFGRFGTFGDLAKLIKVVHVDGAWRVDA